MHHSSMHESPSTNKASFMDGWMEAIEARRVQGLMEKHNGKNEQRKEMQGNWTRVERKEMQEKMKGNVGKRSGPKEFIITSHTIEDMAFQESPSSSL